LNATHLLITAINRWDRHVTVAPSRIVAITQLANHVQIWLDGFSAPLDLPCVSIDEAIGVRNDLLVTLYADDLLKKKRKNDALYDDEDTDRDEAAWE